MILTMGTFDPPHLGHAVFLSHAARLGELLVGVNSDRFIESYRGRRPLFTQRERLEVIGRLGYEVTVNDGPGRDLVTATLPSVIVVGDDWAPPRDYHAQIAMSPRELDRLGVGVEFIPYTPGISSTEIRRRIVLEVGDRWNELAPPKRWVQP